MVTYVHKKSDIGWKTSNDFKEDNVFRKEKEKKQTYKNRPCAFSLTILHKRVFKVKKYLTEHCF